MSYIMLELVSQGGSQGIQWPKLMLILSMFLIPLIIAGIVTYRAHRRASSLKKDTKTNF